MKAHIKTMIARSIYATLNTLNRIHLPRTEPGWVSVRSTDEWMIDEVRPSPRFTKWGYFVDWADDKLDTMLYRYTNELPF
jgi:hypothetical protein